METLEYRQLIETALQEDLGERGDVTSQAVDDRPCQALLLSKDRGILAGVDIFTSVFKHLDPQTEVEFYINNGQPLKPGDRVAKILGQSRTILAAERTALNFLSLLSGIATQTRMFVDTAFRYGRAEILDTRKRLLRAVADLNYMTHRIDQFYRGAKITRSIIELRNAVLTSILIVRAALANNRSLGCHHVE